MVNTSIRMSRNPPIPGFAARLRSLRKSLGWSQQGLANHAGVCRGTIASWENDYRTDPHIDKLAKVASAMNVTVDTLLGKSGASDPTQQIMPRTESRRESVGEIAIRHIKLAKQILRIAQKMVDKE